MATIFNMYKDTESPDIYQEVRASRQESEANTKKTQETAFGMLKKSNIGTLQQQYREGSGRFKGITDPDKKFQVYYDALKALDPQAAQDASKVYAEERQRRINREVADAYKKQGTTGNPDLDAINKAIMELESSITSEEALATQSTLDQQKQAEEQAIQEQAQAEQVMSMNQASGGLNPNIKTGRQLEATPELKIEGEKQSDWSKYGTVPQQETSATPSIPNMQGYAPNISNFYSTDRKMPTFDISLSNEGAMGVEAPYNNPVGSGTGMEGYIPMSRYNNYVPETRNIATFYRGR